MARAFDQIQAELDNYYAPSVNIIQKQLETIPQATEAAIQQADAKKDLAFDQITNAARRRGMGFSGIPLDEQAVYASTEYAPAIARVKGDAENRRSGLLEAIYGINRDKLTRAQSIYDNELQRDLQEKQYQEGVRQFNERMALEKQSAARQAAASAPSDIGAYFGGGGAVSGDSRAPQNQSITPQEQAVFARAKTLQNVRNSGDGTLLGRTIKSLREKAAKGDSTAKAVGQAYYRLINKPVPFKEFQ